jgi:hypothetical protein
VDLLYKYKNMKESFFYLIKEHILRGKTSNERPVVYITPSILDENECLGVIRIIENSPSLLKIIGDISLGSDSPEWKQMWEEMEKNSYISKLKSSYSEKWELIKNFRWSRINVNSIEITDKGYEMVKDGQKVKVTPLELFDNIYDKVSEPMQSFQKWWSIRGNSQAAAFGQGNIKPRNV